LTLLKGLSGLIVAVAQGMQQRQERSPEGAGSV
jgi:flagellar basal body P-ring protein FlgI